jgi:uncharacterized protein (TIGR04255 family)
MHMADYIHSPIIEAFCEIRFLQDTPWDLTIPGLFYEDVKADYPKKESLQQTRVEWQAGPEGISNRITGDISLMRFRREDDKALIQIGPNVLSMHVLPPYPKWPFFRTMIQNGLDSYRKIASPAGFERIGLRYINRISIPSTEPGQQVQIEEYLLALPHLPSPVPQTFLRWFMNVAVPHEDSNGTLAIQTANLPPTESNAINFLLDMDYSALDIQKVSMESSLNWLEMAHQNIENDFESCITDKTRDLFNR